MARQIGVRRIVLSEYGQPIQCWLTDSELSGLRDANARWSQALGLPTDPIRIDYKTDGSVMLRAEQVTGVIRAGNLDLEIAPKFLQSAKEGWQEVLWQILSLVEGGLIDAADTSAAVQDNIGIPDLLADMFIASFTIGSARGLPRRYRSQNAEGPVLRGRFDQSRIVQWSAQPWIVPFIEDALSYDTDAARLFKWTASTLFGMVHSPVRARALRAIYENLSFASNRPPHPLDAHRVQLGSQYRALSPALLVSLLVLQGQGIRHMHGDLTASGFLWNSDEVYERFVYWLCQKVAHTRGAHVDKRTIAFGEIIAGSGYRLETTPDVVFRGPDNSPFAVIDAKYKRFGNRPKASDTYQLIAAAHVLGREKVALTYPAEAHRVATTWRVRSALGGRQLELTALPLDLMVLTKRNGLEELTRVIENWLSPANDDRGQCQWVVAMSWLNASVGVR